MSKYNDCKIKPTEQTIVAKVNYFFVISFQKKKNNTLPVILFIFLFFAFDSMLVNKKPKIKNKIPRVNDKVDTNALCTI